MKSLSKCQGKMIIQRAKLFSINLSRQTNTSSPQQINYAGKLEEDDDAKMCFIAENQ